MSQQLGNRVRSSVESNNQDGNEDFRATRENTAEMHLVNSPPNAPARSHGPSNKRLKKNQSSALTKINVASG